MRRRAWVAPAADTRNIAIVGRDGRGHGSDRYLRSNASRSRFKTRSKNQRWATQTTPPDEMHQNSQRFAVGQRAYAADGIKHGRRSRRRTLRRLLQNDRDLRTAAAADTRNLTSDERTPRVSDNAGDGRCRVAPRQGMKDSGNVALLAVPCLPSLALSPWLNDKRAGKTRGCGKVARTRRAGMATLLAARGASSTLGTVAAAGLSSTPARARTGAAALSRTAWRNRLNACSPGVNGAAVCRTQRAHGELSGRGAASTGISGLEGTC